MYGIRGVRATGSVVDRRLTAAPFTCHRHLHG
jgi:hypothetical protein